MELEPAAATIWCVTIGIGALAVTLVLLGILRVLLASKPRVLATAAVANGQLIVRDMNGHREMVIRAEREMVWSRSSLADRSLSGFRYVDLFHLAAVAARRRRRVLFVGCGGAVAPRQWSELYPGIAIDIVEPERAVIELAHEHFGLNDIPNVELHLGDGREFVAAAPAQSWDIAIVDAYGALELPSTIAEQAFFEALHRAVRPGGAMAINVVGKISGEGQMGCLLDRVRQVFGDPWAVPVLEVGESLEEPRNVVVIARRV